MLYPCCGCGPGCSSDRCRSSRKELLRGAYGGTKEAWIVGAVRTPIGRHGGALSNVRPDDLGAVVLGALMERTGVPPSEVEDVYMGCANQAGEDNRDIARMSLLLVGFPESVADATVNRLCGSGIEAVASAARAVMLGEVSSIQQRDAVLGCLRRFFGGGPRYPSNTSTWTGTRRSGHVAAMVGTRRRGR